MQLLTTCLNHASCILTTLFFNSVHPLTTTYQVKHQLPQDLLTRLVTHLVLILICGFPFVNPILWMFREVLRFRRAELLPKSGLASINPFVFGSGTGSVVVLFRGLATRAQYEVSEAPSIPNYFFTPLLNKMIMNQDICSQVLPQCYACILACSLPRC